MADRDELASIQAYSGGNVSFPYSGAWAQADLQHIGGIFRYPAVAPSVIPNFRGNNLYALFRDKRLFVVFRDKRDYSLFRDKRAEVEGE